MTAAFLSAMNDHTALLVFIIVLVAQFGIPIPTFPVPHVLHAGICRCCRRLPRSPVRRR
jgi:hypothetical protein